MSRIRGIAKAVIPLAARRWIRKAQTAFYAFGLPRTRRIFEASQKDPAYLDGHHLARMQQEYSVFPEFGYDDKSLLWRGRNRASELLRLPGAASAKVFLELGCWDAMVCAILQQEGKRTTAVDRSKEGLDNRAVLAGVCFQQMDVNELRFENSSFDYVFSYDAFEHFPNPEIALQNAIRVLKKGGYLYLNFGPLYMSAFGEHAYDTIRVPYCQFLFSRPTLDEYSRNNGLTPIDYTHVNGWTLECYRSLWKKYSDSIEIVSCRQIDNLTHLDLIRKYPACFKSKTDCFDNLLASNLVLLFRKRD
jgi:SAM-dependent methyltransferase